MAERRSRVRPLRWLLLIVLLLLVLLLLELHRFLPGTWPGGGGASGFRRIDAIEGSDPSRVARPEGYKPDWQPKDGVTLTVRLPGGEVAGGWRLTPGEVGSSLGPDAGGDRALLGDPQLAKRGFSMRWTGGHVTHGAPPADDPVGTWRIALPKAVPPARLTPRPLEVTVVRSTTRQPVPGAIVTVEGEAQPHTADEKGRVTLDGLSGLTALEVRAAGHAPARAHVHPQAGPTAVVELAPLLSLYAPFLDAATRQEAPILAAQLRAKDGRLLWEAVRTGTPRPSRVEAEVAQRDLKGARLTVEAEGRPRTEVSFEPGTREVVLAAPGRTLTIRARDTSGQAVALKRAHASYAANGPQGTEVESAGVLERVEPQADGSVRVTVPAEGPATVALESAQHAPAVIRVDPNDTPGARDVTLEPGVRVPVHVLDRRGRPVRDAEVIGSVVLDGVRVEARARTGPDGIARVGPLPPGPCEIVAQARGRARARVAAEARAPMLAVELRLVPGDTLRLQVASPFGVPLAGVRVSVLPQGGADPEALDTAAWTTDAAGRLVVPDLPVAPFRLRLELPGHEAEVLDGVLPGPVWTFATLVPAD